MTKNLSRLAIMLVVALCVLGLDQVTKAWIATNLANHNSQPLIDGFLRLRYTENTGAAFGLFRGWTGALSIAAAAIIAGIVMSASRVGGSSPLSMVAIGLVLGGAMGNLIDRLRLGYVVDFIDVYGPNIKIENTVYTWPVFNIADSAITVGMLLIMATLLFSQQGSKVQAPSSGF